MVEQLQQTVERLVGRALAPPALSEPLEPGPVEDLEALLDACGWNMSLVARRLGVNRSTILRRMRKAGLSNGR